MVVMAFSTSSLAVVGAGAVLAGVFYTLCAVAMAARFSRQAAQAAADMRVVSAQTTSLTDGIQTINESADRILKSVRTLRKAVVDGW
jgi:NAD(P)H-hydrate repair Nnr-like enzyme with NAD(P)H-hydrate dehydratase domain